MPYRILVTDPLGEAGLEVLRGHPGVEVEVAPGLPREELAIRLAGADAVIIRSGTRLDAGLLERAGRLRVVGRAGAGVDNVDLDAATRRGIVVMNTPGGNAVTTAEHALALLLAAARRIPEADASLRAGRWERKRFLGVELEGKTLGVIGLGNVGSAVARKARGLGMRVIAHDPYLSPERAAELGVTAVGLDELLARADAVTVHVPLSERTRGLIGRNEIARMRPGAILVNCSRGGIVDEAAAAEALAGGHLGAVALDVFEREPPPQDHPLLAAGRTVLTPHLGASTAEAQEKVAVAIARQVLDFLTTVLKPARSNAAAIST